jgi:hypothetical protein
VGLMDGDGSIQVNHWRKKNLQYRLIIKLKCCDENVIMLNLIKNDIGGFVKIIKKDTFVIWVVDNKKSIIKIIKIFDKYPPITIRLKAQLEFLNTFLYSNDIDSYFVERDLKYFNVIRVDYDYDYYYKEWLSGFIEAEGCFSLRIDSNNHSFSIGQKDDLFIIERIHEYFRLQNNIRKILMKNGCFYSIECYRRSILQDIIEHFNSYPLLGQKKTSYNKFKEHLNIIK